MPMKSIKLEFNKLHIDQVKNILSALLNLIFRLFMISDAQIQFARFDCKI